MRQTSKRKHLLLSLSIACGLSVAGINANAYSALLDANQVTHVPAEDRPDDKSIDLLKSMLNVSKMKNVPDGTQHSKSILQSKTVAASASGGSSTKIEEVQEQLILMAENLEKLSTNPADATSLSPLKKAAAAILVAAERITH